VKVKIRKENTIAFTLSDLRSISYLNGLLVDEIEASGGKLNRDQITALEYVRGNLEGYVSEMESNFFTE
jgi:hypothetical protein